MVRPLRFDGSASRPQALPLTLRSFGHRLSAIDHCLRVVRVFSLDFRRATLQLRPAGSLSWRLLCPALLSDHNVAVDRSVSERHWAFLWRLRATGNAITPSPRDGGSYRVALQQYKSFWQDSTLDLCQAGRRRSFARQGLSDEASRSLVLVGVCGGDCAPWGYKQATSYTQTTAP